MATQELAIVQAHYMPPQIAVQTDGVKARAAYLKSLVLNSVSSVHSRAAYGRALDDFFAWWGFGRPFSKALVQEWKARLEADGFASATINQRLSAIRKLATEAADNGMIDSAAAAAIGRVRGAARHGVRAGNWLTRQQTQGVLNSPDAETLVGKRDRALLAILFGCGLRRAEAAALTMAHVQQREGRWCIVDLVGKHGRVRTIPMPSWVKSAIDRWTAAAGITSGCIIRAVNKGGATWGAGVTAKVIRSIVVSHSARESGGHFSAHDCRRTFAKLCRAADGELEQIQLLLGHASIQTTERYLGSQLEIIDAVNDKLRLRA